MASSIGIFSSFDPALGILKAIEDVYSGAGWLCFRGEEEDSGFGRDGIFFFFFFFRFFGFYSGGLVQRM